MNWIITIVIGFFVGIVARFLMPGRDAMGWIVTTVLGIVGSIVATYIGQQMGWYSGGQEARFIGSVLGAMVVLAIYRMVK